MRKIIYLIYYSVKELKNDLIDLLSELKKPKTWSFLLYASFFLATYYRKYTLAYWTIPGIFFVYLIRQNIDGKYKNELFESEIMKNKNSQIVLEHYEKYKKDCFFARKEPSEFSDWKIETINKINKNNKN